MMDDVELPGRGRIFHLDGFEGLPVESEGAIVYWWRRVFVCSRRGRCAFDEVDGGESAFTEFALDRVCSICADKVEGRWHR
jgi:hypothetical protein